MEEKRRFVVTGGAGFIGSSVAARLLGMGHKVVVFDNLSRPGAERNLEWLRSEFSQGLSFVKGDVRDGGAVREVIGGAYCVFHAAAQVAVTSSIAEPKEDFDINVVGTLNLLEAARKSESAPIIIFTSTNKVYGDLENVGVVEKKDRYDFADGRAGIAESQPMDFYSPYGCSKGAADQYVHDYSRIYGLRTVVFRMSCQYGVRQFGVEDQGWVAHFLLCAVFGKKLRLFGTGKQVRDILYVDDLVDAFMAAVERIDKCGGEIFNIGGGKENAVSLLQLLPKIEKLTGKKIDYDFSDWRPGDQKIYISDNAKCGRILGWRPKISIDEGLKRLHDWIQDNRGLWSDRV